MMCHNHGAILFFNNSSASWFAFVAYLFYICRLGLGHGWLLFQITAVGSPWMDELPTRPLSLFVSFVANRNEWSQRNCRRSYILKKKKISRGFYFINFIFLSNFFSSFFSFEGLEQLFWSLCLQRKKTFPTQFFQHLN